MGRFKFAGEGVVKARPEVVWDILTEYRSGHPRILPKPYFIDFTVEEGGRGAGTVMSFATRISGVTRQFRQRVSTPEPGRTLVESSIDGSGATTFTLTPIDGGEKTRVSIETDLAGSSGLRGAIEGLFMPPYRRLITRIYGQEIANLDMLAQTWIVTPQAAQA